MAEEISKLKALYESGGITKEEYEKAKKKLLG
jgi:membrane peptidoglycan carboxypeptidase